METSRLYAPSLTAYQRRETVEVKVGELGIGGANPIRVQSMTTVDTMDTEGSIAQSIRMIEAGCELVRITAPSLKEAENLRAIRDGLRARGYDTPLVADIHFTPNAAELAARIVEKVRVNPGNYADKKRFEVIEYTDGQYEAELDRIRTRFQPLVRICKEHGTAMRIGTNHGSLSDRILSRYGDTPIGMVESALEFLRICEDEGYDQLVISMKSSNPQVMVQAYRLLVAKLDDEGLKPYPLHLGVTEAGEAEDGRIKSAMGIGALLEDGLGDTVRVSLTEEPEAEVPVAQQLVKRYNHRAGHAPIPPMERIGFDPYAYTRRPTRTVANFGGENVPRVFADVTDLKDLAMADLKALGHHYVPVPDKWAMTDLGADYLFTGSVSAPFMLPNGLREVLEFDTWKGQADKVSSHPLLTTAQFLAEGEPHAKLNFVRMEEMPGAELIQTLKATERTVLVLMSDNAHRMPALRRMFLALDEAGIDLPVVLACEYSEDAERFLLHASTDCGGLLVDGFGDGIWLMQAPRTDRADTLASVRLANEASFGILQAARTRITKTEYISCPSCGRTLFDLQETTAMIRGRTDHLKGVKIGIMGCIVNGPGEMADADYGYVGSGVGKITLYKGKEVVKRSVPAAKALDELIELIRSDGRWIEPAHAPESVSV